MAQPAFVPQTNPTISSYSSPPKRGRSWRANRPGEVLGATESLAGKGLGSQGPDQGYVLGLAKRLKTEIHLEPGEHFADVVAGCVAVALKRASLFGRAPVIYDLRAALCLWGYLETEPNPDLVAARRPLFAEVAHAHQYVARRDIADAVAPQILHRPYDAIAETCAADWRASVDVLGVA